MSGCADSAHAEDYTGHVSSPAVSSVEVCKLAWGKGGIHGKRRENQRHGMQSNKCVLTCRTARPAALARGAFHSVFLNLPWTASTTFSTVRTSSTSMLQLRCARSLCISSSSGVHLSPCSSNSTVCGYLCSTGAWSGRARSACY